MGERTPGLRRMSLNLSIRSLSVPGSQSTLDGLQPGIEFCLLSMPRYCDARKVDDKGGCRDGDAQVEMCQRRLADVCFLDLPRSLTVIDVDEACRMPRHQRLVSLPMLQFSVRIDFPTLVSLRNKLEATSGYPHGGLPAHMAPCLCVSGKVRLQRR